MTGSGSGESTPGAGYELVASEEPATVEREQNAAAARRELIAPRPGSPLSLDLVTLNPGARLTLSPDPDHHELVYLLTGTLELTADTQRTSIGPDTAFLADASHPVTVTAHAPARLAVFSAGPGCDEHAPLGEHADSVPLDLDQAGSATGRRSFQTLLGPENGCRRATMFVGVVPPGAAPWHFHQYDEIVYLLDGAASYHQAHGVQPIPAGAAIRIPPRTVHINENTTDDDMLVLGVFTPAGSPAAAYLANDPRPH